MVRKTILAALLALAVGGCGKSLTAAVRWSNCRLLGRSTRAAGCSVKRKAATKLGSLVLIDSLAMPALVGALKDSDAEVRANAARSLGVYSGPRGGEVLPLLRELQERDPNSEVRQMAATAIEKLSK